MSKYDQYVKGFLLANKEVTVEKIGTFSLSRLAADDKTIQTQFIDFQFNKKAQTSEELIDYVVKETGKNRILISSDLSSLFEDARQYTNIGKAFPFAGLGILSLNRSGEYEFSPLQGNTTAIDNTASGIGKASSDSTGKKQTGRNALVFFAFLIIVLIVAGLGWGIYKYINEQKSEASSVTTGNNVADSANGAQNKAGVPAAIQTNVGDSVYYRFVFETTANRSRAHNRYDSLKSWGEHVFIDSAGRDSNAVYQLFVRAKLTVQDTAHARDSLEKYFRRPIKITPQ